MLMVKKVAAFIDAIVNDKETPLNVYDGLKPVLMGLAAKKSSEEHRPVKISEIMGIIQIKRRIAKCLIRIK